MQTINISEDDIFYNYDNGYLVRSKTLYYHSHKPLNQNGRASWVCESVGEPILPGLKEAGVADYRYRSKGYINRGVLYGGRQFAFSMLNGNPPNVGWSVTLYEYSTGHIVGLGKIIEITRGGETSIVVEHTVPYSISEGAYLYFYHPSALATPNLLIPVPTTITIEPDIGNSTGANQAPISVHHRQSPSGKRNQFFSDKLAELNIGDSLELQPGYYAFVSCFNPYSYEISDGGEVYTHYATEAPAAFRIIVAAVSRSFYSLLNGYYCASSRQDNSRHTAPGKSTLYKNGVAVKTNEGRTISSSANIIGTTKDNRIYIAYDDTTIVDDDGTVYNSVNIAEVVGTRATRVFRDRNNGNFAELPAYRIGESLTLRNDGLFGIRELRNLRWIKTGRQIVWASPPSANELPANYDGGRAAIAMAYGDITELISQGNVLRLGNTESSEAAPKIYIVSEIEVIARHISKGSRYALDGNWRDRDDVFTKMVLLSISYSHLSYEDQVRSEILGKYISVARGIEKKSEIWSLEL